MKRKWVTAGLAGLLTVAVGTGTVLATTGSGVGTTFQTAVFDAVDINSHPTPADDWHTQIRLRGQSDVYVVDNKFSVGGTTGWHSHPGPSPILVVSGTVTNYSSDDPTCAPHTYSKGQGFVDPGSDVVHMVRNETAAPAETIAVQILPQGASRRIEEPEPANCHV